VALSFNQKRVAVGIFIIAALICLANRLFSLSLFGDYGKQASIISFLMLGVVMRYFGPTMKELEEHQEAGRRKWEKEFNGET
jgi:hypothetical protein